ncbi:MAG: NAD(P)-dependent alcohol dehydrogenase [Clostridiales Family XIII bacterium]|jgi:aryl-alcohol dehydrogenase|nr:NAD(P)-dependent alcohol dehydrogenase [Clostridiales Family XIII bacterium]
MKIKAAVVREKGGPFLIEDVELAEPKEGEILVRIAGCGICHADISARDQVHPLRLPAVLGHEGAGVVEMTGPGVRRLKAGDHVILHAYACGACEPCLRGHPAYCVRQHGINFGGVHADGTRRLSDGSGTELSTYFNQSSFATYAVAHENNAAKVDEDVDLTLLGPLGCGIQTGAGAVINKLRPQVGDSFVVFGCGTVGMSAIMAAKAAGCTPVIGVDIVASRLEKALELGATHVADSGDLAALRAKIRETTGGGADFSLDTSALPAMVIEALECLKPGGRAAIVGSSGDVATSIKLQGTLMGSARSLEGIVQGDSVPRLFIPRLIRLYKAGMFPFDRIVSFYGFESINEAVEDSLKGVAIKPVLLIG